MPFALLWAQESLPVEEIPGAFAWAVGLAALVAILVCLPFYRWGATRRWSLGALAVLCVGQAALLSNSGVRAAYIAVASVALPGLLASAVLFVPLLLWRRTRRLGLVWLGLSVISAVAFMNQWALVISSIGYVLLLLALWPCWRLLKGTPQGRELSPTIRSRGVLQVHPWPLSGKERGFSLTSALIGVFCLTAAFSMAALMISGTTTALYRADRLARAADLIESARERALLGLAAGDIAGRAAAALPHGQASVERAPADKGLVRVTATATWREPDGRPGRATLEWLVLEQPR